MTQKFIIHEDCELYTSHGSVSMPVIFNAFKKGALTPDFKVAGFKPQGEETSNILDVKDIYAATGKLIRVSGAGLRDHNIIIYPYHKIMNIEGKAVEVTSLKPNDVTISMNGFLTIGFIADLGEKEMQKFYLVELNDNMKTLFVSNVILFSLEESKKEDPFFDQTSPD